MMVSHFVLVSCVILGANSQGITEADTEEPDLFDNTATTISAITREPTGPDTLVDVGNSYQGNLCRDITKYHFPCMLNITRVIRKQLKDQHMADVFSKALFAKNIRIEKAIKFNRQKFFTNKKPCNASAKDKISILITKQSKKLHFVADLMLQKMKQKKSNSTLTDFKQFKNLEQKVCSTAALKAIKDSVDTIWCIAHKEEGSNCKNQKMGQTETKSLEATKPPVQNLGHLVKCRSQLGQLQKDLELTQKKLIPGSFANIDSEAKLNEAQNKIMKLAEDIIEKKQCDDEETKSNFLEIETKIKGITGQLADALPEENTSQIPESKDTTIPESTSEPQDTSLICKSFFHKMQKFSKWINMVDNRKLLKKKEVEKLLEDHKSMLMEAVAQRACDNDIVKSKIDAFDKQLDAIKRIILPMSDISREKSSNAKTSSQSGGNKLNKCQSLFRRYQKTKPLFIARASSSSKPKLESLFGQLMDMLYEEVQVNKKQCDEPDFLSKINAIVKKIIMTDGMVRYGRVL